MVDTYALVSGARNRVAYAHRLGVVIRSSEYRRGGIRRFRAKVVSARERPTTVRIRWR